MKAAVLFIICMGFALDVWSKDHELKDCHHQMKELCKGKHGAGMFACIKENKANLSPECQEKLEAKKAKWKGHAEACSADREKFCSEVKPGEGRVIECMNKNLEQLSADCKAHVQKEKAEPAKPIE